MNSLRPILSTTEGSAFPLHILRSPKRPCHIRRRPFASPPTIVGATSHKSASSATASPPSVSSALQSDAGGSDFAISLLWEERIEKVIYSCRFLTFLGVFGSLMGSVICYLKGCAYVMNSFTEYVSSGGKVILSLVEALDIYLIGTVMLVFGMGLYELFISNFDVAKSSSYGSSLIGLFKLPERPKWLEIQTVRELKTKVGHVIVLVLLIGLLDKSMKVQITSSSDLLCLAATIFLSSGDMLCRWCYPTPPYSL
ncbi:hypothetical protein KSP39_PZI022549 [Platanthera zijinensis]|uniref:Uncharacterized protein n=1 Tax=Platanthera zijinensis TaxID=2320716 RepID=A0AAP0AUE9_9ASPA